MADKFKIIKKAQKLINKGQILKAIGLWEDLAKKEIEGSIFNTIGDLYLRLKDQEKAIESYKRAATTFRTEGFTLKAIAINKKILNISPYDVIALEELAVLSDEKNLKVDAIRNYMLAAEIYLKNDQTEKFYQLFEKVKMLDPRNISLRNHLIEYYLKEGLKNEAAKEYYNIAMIKYESQEYDSIQDNINKIFEISPKNRDLYLKIAKLFSDMGKIDEYEKTIQRIRDQFSEEPVTKEEVFAEETIEEPFKAVEEEEISIEIALEETEERPVVKEEASAEETIEEPFKAIEEEEISFELAPEETEEKPVIKEDISAEETLEEVKNEPVIEEKVSDEKKTIESMLSEADTCINYRLMNEAREILEELKFKDAQNIEVHNRLKTVYKELSEKELFVTECIILSNLYEREGEKAKQEQILNEAIEFYPEDTRLQEFIPKVEGEAIEHVDIEEGKIAMEKEEIEAPSETEIIQESVEEQTLEDKGKISLEGDLTLEESMEIEQPPEVSKEVIGEEKTYDKIEKGLPDVENESDVLNLFESLKKDIDKQISKEDYKDRYNLGIAYKEMGLIDDAISEFQNAKNDENIAAQALSMLGHCYREKKNYDSAIESFNDVLKIIDKEDKAYWGTKYDIAEVFEESKQYKKAFETFFEISSWDSQFREVGEKIDSLKKIMEESSSQESPDKDNKDRISYQ